MGRPKEHNEQTAASLLDAAERIAGREGVGALSVRRIANEVGTTTRAVYTLFGAKEGLVSALGERVFELLRTTVSAVALTDDPAADLVQAGLVFRRFAKDHAALFRVGVEHIDVSLDAGRAFAGAADLALAVLKQRILRLDVAGKLGDRPIDLAALEFHSLCEGLATVEARCSWSEENAEHLWADALSALIRGWASVTL